MSIIEDKLRSLGAVGLYKGYEMAKKAIELVLEDEFRLLDVTKSIYMEVAAKCNHNNDWNNVERNIRTVVSRVWRINRPLLCRMAGYPLEKKPSASEFIEIVASHIIRTSTPQGEERIAGNRVLSD